MSAWVLLWVTLLFVAALVVMFRFSHDVIERESLAKAEQMLAGTVLRVEDEMHEVEVASRSMHWSVERHLDSPELMAPYCIEFLEDNPDVMGCAVVFEPGYYNKERGGLFMNYAYRMERGSANIQMTDNPTALEPGVFGKTPYVGANWYFIPMQVGETLWVRPHVPNDTLLSSIVTCCNPIREKSGRVVGVFAVDISIDKMSKAVLESKPYPNSYGAMLGVQGTYLIHPDSTKIYHGLVSDIVKSEPDKRFGGLVESMLAGENGIRKVTLGGQDCYVLYQGVNNGHWSACIVCPESDIFYSNHRLLFYMIGIIMFGLLFIVAFCFIFITQQLQPLGMLVKSTQRMARGDFSESIPPTDRQDEIGNLQESFNTMQQSLAKNIEDSQKLSEELQHRNEELSATYEHVREADRIKTNFIHQMADKMIPPALFLDTAVDNMRKNPRMKPAAFRQLSDQAMQSIRTITTLIDQMFAEQH